MRTRVGTRHWSHGAEKDDSASLIDLIVREGARRMLAEACAAAQHAGQNERRPALGAK